MHLAELGAPRDELVADIAPALDEPDVVRALRGGELQQHRILPSKCADTSELGLGEGLLGGVQTAPAGSELARYAAQELPVGGYAGRARRRSSGQSANQGDDAHQPGRGAGDAQHGAARGKGCRAQCADGQRERGDPGRETPLDSQARAREPGLGSRYEESSEEVGGGDTEPSAPASALIPRIAPSGRQRLAGSAPSR